MVWWCSSLSRQLMRCLDGVAVFLSLSLCVCVFGTQEVEHKQETTQMAGKSQRELDLLEKLARRKSKLDNMQTENERISAKVRPRSGWRCTGHRAQSTEHRAQSTEHRAQSTEHRLWRVGRIVVLTVRASCAHH
eukprot:COSAG01_NODE_2907_length_6880_cov_10.488204_9_plen_134_part_00